LARTLFFFFFFFCIFLHFRSLSSLSLSLSLSLSRFSLWYFGWMRKGRKEEKCVLGAGEREKNKGK